MYSVVVFRGQPVRIRSRLPIGLRGLRPLQPPRFCAFIVQLEEHLSKTTYLKVKDIVSYVRGEFGKEYSRSGMTTWLKEQGFTFKRPEKVPGKIDPIKQAEHIEKYMQLKASLGPSDALYFVDAVHPEYQSQAVWLDQEGGMQDIADHG